jgi:phage terminase large subunit-like protein
MPISASPGKAMRAEPISLLYEKGRVLQRRGLDRLEAEMMAVFPRVGSRR